MWEYRDEIGGQRRRAPVPASDVDPGQDAVWLRREALCFRHGWDRWGEWEAAVGEIYSGRYVVGASLEMMYLAGCG